MHYAAQLGQADIAKSLMDRGADQQAKDHDGKTPLQLVHSSNPALMKKTFAHYANKKPTALKQKSGSSKAVSASAPAKTEPAAPAAKPASEPKAAPVK